VLNYRAWGGGAMANPHLKPYEASGQQIRSLGRFAKRTAIKAASQIHGGNVVVEIELEEGSLIGRAAVIGGILLGVCGAGWKTASAKWKLFLEPAAFVGHLDAAWIARCCRPGWLDQCHCSSAHAVELRDQKSLLFDVSQRASCTAN